MPATRHGGMWAAIILIPSLACLWLRELRRALWAVAQRGGTASTSTCLLPSLAQGLIWSGQDGTLVVLPPAMCQCWTTLELVEAPMLRSGGQ